MKYELIVFDMDGTILDTLEDLKNSMNYTLRLHNMPERTLDEIRSFVGNGIRKLIERAVPSGTSNDKIDIIHKDFMKHYEVHCADFTKPYNGVNDLIKGYYDNNKKIIWGECNGKRVNRRRIFKYIW